MKRKHLSIYWTFIILFSVFTLISFLLSRSTPFCDFYTDHLFSVGLQTYGRLTGLFPFSVGEILIVLALLLVLLQIIFPLLLVPLHKKSNYKIFVIRYSKFMLAFVLLVIWIMTMNCATLYNCSKLGGNENSDTHYSSEQIRELRNFIVEKCNTLSLKMTRDENGNVLTDSNTGKKIKESMLKLSSEYPRLSGYYPNPKPIFSSYMMYQAGYDGVYFPFSLEANYNSYISDIRYPHVACHELAHLKGYIYEDEADFIAYLACVGSDDEQLQYAGYLGVLNYIDSDYWDSVGSEDYLSSLEITDLVYNDCSSYTTVTEEQLAEMPEMVDTETVASVSQGFTDAYMDYYDAEPNYAEVTKLLLAYYYRPGAPGYSTE